MIIGIALLFGLAGCGQSNQTSAEAETEQEATGSIRVAQTGWGNIEEALTAAGLDDTPYEIEYSVFQGGNLILEAMTAGHVDFGVTSEIPPIFSSLSQKGDQSQVIAVQQSNTLNQELIVQEGSDIETVTDLKGKKVAYVQNTTAHYFLIKMLEEAGLTWEDVDAVELTTSDGIAALLGGNVDALASYGNAIISGHQKGAKTIASAKEILSGDFHVNANTDAINDPTKQEAIVDLLDRINQSQQWQRENAEEWSEIVAKNTNQPYELAFQTFKEGEEQQPTRIVPLSETTTDSQQDIVNVFHSAGIIDQEIDVSEFWDHEFDERLAEVLK